MNKLTRQVLDKVAKEKSNNYLIHNYEVISQTAETYRQKVLEIIEDEMEVILRDSKIDDDNCQCEDCLENCAKHFILGKIIKRLSGD